VGGEAVRSGWKRARVDRLADAFCCSIDRSMRSPASLWRSNPGDPGIYLLYCDHDWNAVTDTYHDDRDHAIAQAEYEVGPLRFVPFVA
jgi:hypothetical protein